MCEYNEFFSNTGECEYSFYLGCKGCKNCVVEKYNEKMNELKKQQEEELARFEEKWANEKLAEEEKKMESGINVFVLQMGNERVAISDEHGCIEVELSRDGHHIETNEIFSVIEDIAEMGDDFRGPSWGDIFDDSICEFYWFRRPVTKAKVEEVVGELMPITDMEGIYKIKDQLGREVKQQLYYKRIGE